MLSEPFFVPRHRDNVVESKLLVGEGKGWVRVTIKFRGYVRVSTRWVWVGVRGWIGVNLSVRRGCSLPVRWRLLFVPQSMPLP